VLGYGDKLRMANKRMVGFTAIELMIVLAIMGIMLVAAAPSFVQFTRNSRIKSGAQTVVSALRTARSHAIKRRKRCAVLFNFNTDAHNIGYAVKIYWDPGTDADPRYSEGGSVTNWKTLPKTIIMTPKQGTTLLNCVNIPFPNDANTTEPTVPAIVFKPTGGATSSRTIEVSDVNKNDTSYIEIQMITGRIKTSRTQ
jgi:prepilin-type N-terminal cleavage/methylation domain-containing protein